MFVAPLEATEKEDFEQAMAVHFWGPYGLTMATLPLLRRASPSRIVNISSIGGKVAVPDMAPYCASKFALTGFTDAIRSELARQGVQLTTVCPRLMRTGSHINAEFKDSHAKEFAWFSIRRECRFWIPLRTGFHSLRLPTAIRSSTRREGTVSKWCSYYDRAAGLARLRAREQRDQGGPGNRLPLYELCIRYRHCKRPAASP
jgi:NAD(P)-dependent dehydrogenase (short-subunit alcohol dehydrogenase family)